MPVFPKTAMVRRKGSGWGLDLATHGKFSLLLPNTIYEAIKDNLGAVDAAHWYNVRLACKKPCLLGSGGTHL